MIRSSYFIFHSFYAKSAANFLDFIDVVKLPLKNLRRFRMIKSQNDVERKT